MISSPGWVWLGKATPGAMSSRTWTASRPATLRAWRCRSVRATPTGCACAAGMVHAFAAKRAANASARVVLLESLLMSNSCCCADIIELRGPRRTRQVRQYSCGMDAGIASLSDQRGRDLDVAADRLGIGADAVRRIDQLLRHLAVDAGQADIEARTQEESAAGEVQVDLGVDGPFIRKLDLALRGGEFDCAEIAGRPGCAEQVFGGRVRLRQPDVELAVPGLRSSVAAGGDVGLSGEENFFSRGHGVILWLMI